MARVSVVIPSYQHERFLGAALDSLEAQTRPPDEIVVVDDGSKDGSVALVKARLRPGLRLLEQENRGAHAALNRGIEETTGEIVFLLNSDDRFAPERVETLASLLEEGPGAGLASSWLRLIDAKGKALGVKEAWRNMHPWPARRPERTFVATPNARWNLLQGNYLATTSNFAFRRELWEKAGGDLSDACLRPMPNSWWEGFQPERIEPLSALVLHHTAGDEDEHALSIFADPARFVSSHFLVGKDGRLWQLVSLEHRAWHAGSSYLHGRSVLNRSSVGVEITGDGNRYPFTRAQIDTVARLVGVLTAQLGLEAPWIAGHEHVAPGRKVDPGERFPWNEVMRRALDLAERLRPHVPPPAPAP